MKGMEANEKKSSILRAILLALPQEMQVSLINCLEKRYINCTKKRNFN